MPLPRLKLRTLIVLVTVATFAVGGVEYGRRSARYRSLAAQELLAEQQAKTAATRSLVRAQVIREDFRRLTERNRKTDAMLRAAIVLDDELAEWIGRRIGAVDARARDAFESSLESFEGTAAKCVREAAGHARHREAYLRCARHPWLSPPAGEAGWK